jgi:hypothetical protein
MEMQMYAINNGEWNLRDNIPFSFDHLGFYNKRNESCWCSGCFGYKQNPMTFLRFSFYYTSDPDLQYDTRNYLNFHCIQCVCKWCVCDKRFAAKLFQETSIPASRVLNDCDCAVCADTDMASDSSYFYFEYPIMRRADYSELLNLGEQKYWSLFNLLS